MTVMTPAEIIAAYKETKKRSVHMLFTGGGSGVLSILLFVLSEHVPGMDWLVWVQAFSAVLSICMLVRLWFVFRCPRCGAFLGSRYRLQRREGWQVFPPKSCWYCHVSFLTGEELPHEKRKWRGMDIE